MNSSRHSGQVLRRLAVGSPLPVIAAAVLWNWTWWVTLIPVLVAVAIAAELAGIYQGVLTALVATAGIVLVVNRDDASNAHNGIELGVMAALLLIAVLFGTDAPGER
jgi:hypothetical protein